MGRVTAQQKSQLSFLRGCLRGVDIEDDADDEVRKTVLSQNHIADH
jgi:hypothetical protein